MGLVNNGFSFRKREQTDEDRLNDKIVAAMETGNAGQARLLVAEHRETYPDAIARIQRQVQKDYGIRI